MRPVVEKALRLGHCGRLSAAERFPGRPKGMLAGLPRLRVASCSAAAGAHESSARAQRRSRETRATWEREGVCGKQSGKGLTVGAVAPRFPNAGSDLDVEGGLRRFAARVLPFELSGVCTYVRL